MAVPFCLGKLIDMIYNELTSEQKDLKKKLQDVYKVLVAIFLLGALANFGRVYLMQISGKVLLIVL